MLLLSCATVIAIGLTAIMWIAEARDDRRVVARLSTIAADAIERHRLHPSIPPDLVAEAQALLDADVEEVEVDLEEMWSRRAAGAFIDQDDPEWCL